MYLIGGFGAAQPLNCREWALPPTGGITNDLSFSEREYWRKTVNSRLFAGCACGVALLLGACSSNDGSGTTATGSGATTTIVTPAIGDNEGNGDNGGSDGSSSIELSAAEKAYSDAETAVEAALAAVQAAASARTPATREAATEAIEAARRALNESVAAAEAAVAAAEDPAALGKATRTLNTANSYRASQEAELDAAQVSFAWYSRELIRYTFANGNVAVPSRGTNTATIKRIPRTIPTSPTDDTQIVNPDAFTSTTFKDVMYEDGKEVFSVNDDDGGGDEFKVDGYAVQRGSAYDIDPTIYTGLRLTNAGLVIRTGGSGQDVAFSNPFTHFRGDSTDFRRKITTWANDGDGDADVDTNDGIWGQNGWDLEIAFDEPQTRPVSNKDTSWTGNGDYYWSSIVRADSSQLETNGEYYDENAFGQPDGFRDLGTYEVWLSNHIGVLDRNLEPVAGSGKVTCPSGFIGTSCPDDDENHYLNYAAYGLFVYTPNPETFQATGGFQAYNGRVGRINTIHFGYSAFGSGDGQKTTDIGEAITSGRFHGHTLAYEVSGDQSGSGPALTSKLLRGDVTLTVNIPKGSGTGTLEGTMNNFQQWNEGNRYWAAYADNFAVALNSADIGENGAFSGTAQATPSTDLGNSGAGVFKGNFYGPRADADDLEVAGSWSIGASDQINIYRDLYGSFGAKQRR